MTLKVTDFESSEGVGAFFTIRLGQCSGFLCSGLDKVLTADVTIQRIFLNSFSTIKFLFVIFAEIFSD